MIPRSNNIEGLEQHVGANRYKNRMDLRLGNPIAHQTITIENVVYTLSENSLLALRVKTLKAIAQHLNLKLGGKKSELTQRILEATRYGVPSHNKNFVCKNTRRSVLTEGIESLQKSQSDIYCSASSTPSSIVRCVASKEPFPGSIVLNSNYFPFQNKLDLSIRNCLCQGLAPFWPESLLRCGLCDVVLHATCMRISFHENASETPPSFVCPKCCLLEMDPFLAPVELLWFTYFHLGQQTTLVKSAEGETTCFLRASTIIQVLNLQQWRRKNYEVVVRCMKLGNSDKQLSHVWPRTLDLKFGRFSASESCEEFKTVESIAAPRPDHRRRDTPMIITHYLMTGNNQIEVVISERLSENLFPEMSCYALGVILCETKTIAALMTEIENKTNETYEDHKNRVITTVRANYQKSEEDDDVACIETNSKMRLTCPITLTRIKTPGRGRFCKHLQCFDINSFLTVTRASKAFNNRWRCPECTLIIRPPTGIVLDRFVHRVLEETLVSDESDNIVSVEINLEGNWSPVEKMNFVLERDFSESEKPTLFHPETIVVEEIERPVPITKVSEYSESSKKRSRQRSQTPTRMSLKKSKPTSAIVIDLFSSSESENETLQELTLPASQKTTAQNLLNNEVLCAAKNNNDSKSEKEVLTNSSDQSFSNAMANLDKMSYNDKTICDYVCSAENNSQRKNLTEFTLPDSGNLSKNENVSSLYCKSCSDNNKTSDSLPVLNKVQKQKKQDIHSPLLTPDNFQDQESLIELSTAKHKIQDNNCDSNNLATAATILGFFRVNSANESYGELLEKAFATGYVRWEEKTKNSLTTENDSTILQHNSSVQKKNPVTPHVSSGTSQQIPSRYNSNSTRFLNNFTASQQNQAEPQRKSAASHQSFTRFRHNLTLSNATNSVLSCLKISSPCPKNSHHTSEISRNSPKASTQNYTIPQYKRKVSRRSPRGSQSRPRSSHHSPKVTHTPRVSQYSPEVTYNSPRVSHHSSMVSNRSSMVSQHSTKVSRYCPRVSHHDPEVPQHDTEVLHHGFRVERGLIETVKNGSAVPRYYSSRVVSHHSCKVVSHHNSRVSHSRPELSLSRPALSHDKERIAYDRPRISRYSPITF